MASSSPSPSNKPYHVRSISIPSRSPPISVRVEEGLHKIKTWAASSLLEDSSPSAEALLIALESLEETYSRMEELLRLPRTQQALARCEKLVAQELDGSVRLLDVCGTVRDVISSVKEQAQGKISAFIRCRKLAHKDSSRCLKSLKQLRERCLVSPVPAADHDLSLALKATKDLRDVTIVMFQSISSFLSRPASSSTAKWNCPPQGHARMRAAPVS